MRSDYNLNYNPNQKTPDNFKFWLIIVAVTIIAISIYIHFNI